MRPAATFKILGACVGLAVGAVLMAAGGTLAVAAPSALRITPETAQLRGRGARQHFLVSGVLKSGRSVDLTPQARFSSATPEIIAVDEHGVVTPLADGMGRLVVEVTGQQIEAQIDVTEAQTELPVDFETHIQPIFTRRECNAGACHGKQRGQNGFWLSLLGFDDDFDYRAVTKSHFSRRLLPAFPDESLLLMKPAGALPHGGGVRLPPSGDDYQVVKRWIRQGMPRRSAEAPTLTNLTVFPAARIMSHEEQQRLLVTVHFSDGSTRDVTGHTNFLSSESPIARVDEEGTITAGTIPGESTIMARYRGLIATCDVTIPLPDKVDAEFYAQLPQRNFIDGHVWNKLARIGIKPSEPCSDQVYLRRAYVDVVGRLPTPQESRAFLNDSAPHKRATLVEYLLERPEYADHWANKWVDLLRPNPYRTGMKSVLNLDYWVRNSFRQNKPYDVFVRELVTARGSTFRNGATTVFRDRRSPDEITTMVSQLFLGIRLECAKCHKHPFEIWRQADFYSFAAYFARVGRKGGGLSLPISGAEEFVFSKSDGTVVHPRTQQKMTPRPLFGTAEVVDGEDPRAALARWMTHENPFFARVMVNRVWADLMGRGLVEPIDDLRATNPPSNEPLLAALAQDFAAQKYDLKQLLRRIMSSYVYALSSAPTTTNVLDARYYSRHFRQRLRAEVLLDVVCDITQVPEKFDAMPPASRAVEIWTHRTPSFFLDTFGRPDRNQDPPCYRMEDTSVVQALHLMNAPNLHAKVTDDAGRAAQLAGSERPAEEIVEELYLLVYCRPPNARERERAAQLFAAEKSGAVSESGADPATRRRRATEDLLWALLNTPEFVFKD